MTVMVAFSLSLIAAGAGVMAICIKRFGPVVRQLRQVSEKEYIKNKHLSYALTTLMSFFLVGYMAVAIAIMADIRFTGELFVGVIFFFGAIFVLLVIMLQSKMTAALKHRYDEAIHANQSLETQRENLSRLNERLTSENRVRLEAEKALSASKMFLQHIIDALPEQIMVINRDYSIALANRSALDLSGLVDLPEKIYCHQISHGRNTPCSDDLHPCPIADILRYGKPVTTEHTHMDAAGNSVVLEIIATPLFDERGDICQIVESCRDITSRWKAEERLRESEHKYRRLSEVTVEGICFNDNGMIIDVNEAFARMFGYRREELIGIDLVKNLIVAESMDPAGRIFGTHSKKAHETVGVKKDGTRFPVEIEGRAVRYNGDEVYVSSLRDITDRKRAEQRMATMQKMEAIGTLAGGIAHDFNNILAAIMGYAEMCLLDADPRQKLTSRLENILQASHRARELVAQILSFNRKEEGGVRPVNVGVIAREALKLLRPSIPTTIEIITDIEKDSGYIDADATRIHQILMNLCTNAAHAMRSDGGTLTIGLSKVDIRKGFQNHMAEVVAGAYLRLRVADTGHGMDSQTLGRIFEPYFTTKEKGEGTGLGLFVVHGIVHRFHGWMDVASKPGQGTTISIFFPRIEPQVVDDATESRLHSTGTETILLVDDDAQLLNMTSEMLSSLGYRVIPAAGAAEALRLFENVPDSVDLVITDQTMPGMTGEKLIVRLREIRPALPAIVCTGYSDTMDQEKAGQRGIDGFFMKPVRMVEVAQTIRHILDRAQP